MDLYIISWICLVIGSPHMYRKGKLTWKEVERFIFCEVQSPFPVCFGFPVRLGMFLGCWAATSRQKPSCAATIRLWLFAGSAAGQRFNDLWMYNMELQLDSHGFTARHGGTHGDPNSWMVLQGKISSRNMECIPGDDWI